jgi:hypothetical protein
MLPLLWEFVGIYVGVERSGRWTPSQVERAEN